MSKKKGLNMEKVNKVMESVEEVMNTEVKKVVVDISFFVHCRDSKGRRQR